MPSPFPAAKPPTPRLTDRFLPGHTRAAQDVLGQCVPQLSTRAATVVLTLRIPPALAPSLRVCSRSPFCTRPRVRVHVRRAPPQIAVYTFPVLWLALLIVSILKFNLSCVQPLPLRPSVSRSADRARHLDPFPTAPRAHPRLRDDPASCQLSSSRSSSTSRTPSASHTRAYPRTHAAPVSPRSPPSSAPALHKVSPLPSPRPPIPHLPLLSVLRRRLAFSHSAASQGPRREAEVGEQPRVLGLELGHGRPRRPDPHGRGQEQRRPRLPRVTPTSTSTPTLTPARHTRQTARGGATDVPSDSRRPIAPARIVITSATTSRLATSIFSLCICLLRPMHPLRYVPHYRPSFLIYCTLSHPRRYWSSAK